MLIFFDRSWPFSDVAWDSVVDIVDMTLSEPPFALSPMSYSSTQSTYADLDPTWVHDMNGMSESKPQSFIRRTRTNESHKVDQDSAPLLATQPLNHQQQEPEVELEVCPSMIWL